MNPRSALVVEDDPQIQRLLQESLQDEGYEVRAALNGREALDLLDGWLPDIILLDLLMPVMDGRRFRAEQLRLDLGVAVPLLVLSASRDGRGVARELSATEFVAKPFELDDLLDAVERCSRVG